MTKRIVVAITFLVLFVTAAYFLNQDKNKAPNKLTEIVSEALLRVPLPPMPESLIKSYKSSTQAEKLNATSTYQRELFGVTTVTEAVTDPTTECHTDFVNPFECYANYFTYTTERSGIDVAIKKIKEMYNSGDTYIATQCHQLTHVIGRAAATKFPVIAEAYNYGDTFCWSGYYHGVMEAIIAEIGLANIPTKLNEICDALPGKDTYSFNYYNCVHGLGHGTMYVSGHELFDALELCDLLTGSWERESCYGGVFMENVIANDIDHISLYLKPDNLLYPCDSVNHQYKYQCYLMQTSYMLGETGYDFPKVFKLCSTVEIKYRNICYQSLGRDASGSTLSNIEETKKLCLLGPNFEAKSNCIVGAVKDFISYFHSDRQANELCQTLPEELIGNCLEIKKAYYTNFSEPS